MLWASTHCRRSASETWGTTAGSCCPRHTLEHVLLKLGELQKTVHKASGLPCTRHLKVKGLCATIKAAARRHLFKALGPPCAKLAAPETLGPSLGATRQHLATLETPGPQCCQLRRLRGCVAAPEGQGLSATGRLSWASTASEKLFGAQGATTSWAVYPIPRIVSCLGFLSKPVAVYLAELP